MANLKGADLEGAEVAGAIFRKKDFNPDWLKGAKNVDRIILLDDDDDNDNDDDDAA